MQNFIMWVDKRIIMQARRDATDGIMGWFLFAGETPLVRCGLSSKFSHHLSHFRRHRSTTTHVDAAYCYRCSFICLSVCRHRSWALQKPLNRSDVVWMWTKVGPRDYVLDGVQIPMPGAILKGERGNPFQNIGNAVHAQRRCGFIMAAL